MRAGELPRVVQDATETEPAERTEGSADGPANTHARGRKVADREEQDRSPEPRSDQAQQEHETLERKSGSEALLCEQPGGLVPARRERDPAQAAYQREAARRLVCGQEFELQLEPSPELGRHVHTHRKMSVRGA